MISNAFINVIQALRVGAVAHRPYRFSCRFDQVLVLGQEGGGQLLVKAEKVLHPLPLAGEGLGAVAQIHRPVQFRMGFDQCRRHRERVIQVRQRRRLRGADLRSAGERLLWRRGG